MRTKQQVYHWIISMAAAFLMLSAQTLWAAETGVGTVLIIKGQAFLKESPQSDWAPLQKGVQVKDGSAVKTGPESLVRILTPDGSLLNISAGNEGVLNFSQKDPGKKEGGFSAVVSEFFSPYTQTRINAVRALSDPMMKDWNAFCQFDRIAAEDIEKYLEIAASYQNEKIDNRMVFILWKLHDLFPDNPGLKALADQAVGQYQNPGRWEMIGVIQGKETDIENRVEISKGDAIQVRYRSPHESYVYVFRTSKTADGNLKTVRLFPNADSVMALEEYKLPGLSDYEFFASRIAAEELMFVKEDGVSVKKDNSILADEIGVLKKGQPVEILKYGNGLNWLVKADNHLKGWVRNIKLTSAKLPVGRISGEVIAEVIGDDVNTSSWLWGFSAPGPLPVKLISRIISESETALGKGDEQAVRQTLPKICGAFSIVQLSVSHHP